MAQRMYPLIDRALGGTLEARLRQLREDGESYDEIAHNLRSDNITVSGETIRKWCIDLEIDAATERAS